MEKVIGSVHRDLLARAAAFLLLKDSRASFAIEGERPSTRRVERWGQVIGLAGESPLDEEELLRLQSIVIGDARFTRLGWRSEGGFVGMHDRRTGEPIPDHISARWEDVPDLIGGLLETERLLREGGANPLLTAAAIAFGFVFIHPFEDGNGRMHRYLIHHILTSHGFTPKGIVFPVSAVILDRIEEYRRVLEDYSRPRLHLIEWRPTEQGNVSVLNDTSDLYRFFDATHQAEFLSECVKETVYGMLPGEVAYLERYDRMKRYVDTILDMPDRKIDLLTRSLEQGQGTLSKRAVEKEFSALTASERTRIEKQFGEIFRD